MGGLLRRSLVPRAYLQGRAAQPRNWNAYLRLSSALSSSGLTINLRGWTWVRNRSYFPFVWGLQVVQK
ncbi:hypothetical protein CEXT_431761 [Caerostris extrusa]|uniref:Uncharacterized protein n=1 Tax=Caerostris extrusa TaxID=172846 RepID=A0AAV4T4F5_CAEEX|nr:hypothetical protein CEXT_431761 [Caerostris extrusa]